MTAYIGLDIGGTKIAGGAFSSAGEKLCEIVQPTPQDYSAFLTAILQTIEQIESQIGTQGQIGLGIPGAVDSRGAIKGAPNLPFLPGKPLAADIKEKMGRDIRLANDANCLALAEAIDGAGQGYNSVLGLIMGTGIGGGIIHGGKIIDGANGLAGEFGHFPLPFRDEADGPVVACNCKQMGCIEKAISGAALGRLYTFMTGKEADARQIADDARAGEAEALRVLDRYYEVAAKAMTVILHSIDPEVIVVSGGLNNLPGMYTEIPKRVGKYCYFDKPVLNFVPALHGPMAGMRGAAWLWRTD